MSNVSPTEVAAVGGAVRQLLLAGDQIRSALAARLHINVTELTALGHLTAADELTPKQLGQLLGITTGSVTGMVDHLESAGLIARIPNPVDRRSVLVQTTSVAEEAMEGVYATYHAALAHALAQETTVSAPEFAHALEQAGEALSRAATRSDGPAGRPARGRGELRTGHPS